MVTAGTFSAKFKLTVLAPPWLVMLGASFTSLTKIVAVLVLALKGVLTPLTMTFTFAPAAPLPVSQAR